MQNLIVIKSYQNGISIHMDKEASFDDILLELGEKFSKSRFFFRDIKVALSIEGRTLNVEEEKAVIKTIMTNSDVEILCLVGKDETTNKEYIKALKRLEYEKEENNGRFYRGNLKDGQVLETEGSIVIIGNVEKGAAVISAKDIIVVGAVFGEVYAGASGDSGHFIMALQFEPQKCKIGDNRYHTKEKAKWQLKQKYQPQIIYCVENQIMIETITKELPDL